MADISDAAKATRRRALGRKLIGNSSNLRIMVAGIRDSSDLKFLGTKEAQALDKLLNGLDSVAGGFDKVGTRLDKK